MSLAVYGLLGAGGLVLALAQGPERVKAEPRQQAIILSEFEQVAAAAPSGAGPGLPASPRAVPSEPTPAPDQVPATPRALPPTAPIVAEAPVAGTGAGSGSPAGASAGPGVPGGVAGGMAGGVAGGVSGGVAGGRLGAAVPPRFDAAYLHNPAPDYPALSRRLGEEGRVLLRVLVTAEGLPDQIEVKAPSGSKRLDAAAVATVRRWRFAAAHVGDQPVSAWVLVPISFHLDA